MIQKVWFPPQSLDGRAGAVSLKGSPQEYDILCLWQPGDKHLRSGPFLRHTSPFTALQYDAHLHINSRQPPPHSTPTSANTQTGAQGGRCRRQPSTHTVHYTQLHTAHIRAHMNTRWFIFIFFFPPSFLISTPYINASKTFTCFVIGLSGAYALPSFPYITHHANERECQSSAADGQGW